MYIDFKQCVTAAAVVRTGITVVLDHTAGSPSLVACHFSACSIQLRWQQLPHALVAWCERQSTRMYSTHFGVCVCVCFKRRDVEL